MKLMREVMRLIREAMRNEDSKGNDVCKFNIVPHEEKLAIICSAPSYKACILLVKATGWLFICVVYKYPC